MNQLETQSSLFGLSGPVPVRETIKRPAKSKASVFDATASREAKERGIELAANNNGALLTEAREIAETIARERGTVNADDVIEAMVDRGYGVHCLGNAAGSLFAGRKWKFTGVRVKSRRRHSHCNELKVWRLK